MIQRLVSRFAAIQRRRVAPAGALARSGSENSEKIHSGVGIQVRLFEGGDDFVDSVASDEIERALVSEMSGAGSQFLAVLRRKC